MPYIIAIILIAVAALVFFSRPSAEEHQTVTTAEPTQAPTATEETMTDDTTTPPAPTPTTDDTATAEPTDDTPAPIAETPAVTQTLTAASSYLTPARKEHGLDVSLTLEDNVVTAVNVLYDGAPAATPQHRAFDSNYKSEVIGVAINEVYLSRVGGASLTTDAFNDAVANIKTQL